MNLLTDARASLVERLQTITVANGYLTNAGHNVLQGWFNEVLKSTVVAFPLIVVQKAPSEAPEPGPGAIKTFPGFSVIGAVKVGLDNYESALEDIEVDLIRCLMPDIGQRLTWTPRGISGVTVGAPEQWPPGEGEPSARVIVPFHMHAIIRR